jgi:hypothetical protein
MINLFIKGGPIMILLGLCSFYGCYIVVQKLLFFKVNTIQKETVIRMITQHFVNLGKPATIQKLSQSRSATHRILAMSIAESDQPHDIIQDTIQHTLPNTAPRTGSKHGCVIQHYYNYAYFRSIGHSHWLDGYF